ncbi:MFS general substrate transporter [Gonapodya prolifera JEL478]|uniref:MFS general substrate transporter n=1 Tax=Gonapodya prolifera (strain JEL478) TaxID=1344416 RepID=A0A139AQF3_GONPJ|nr:MFS general substrate transporter [Gonapodya prolifera JEL478]|eukprot:KXS18715.1 MFS general substrate transporter [Gonapodya prolifera JEL478]
MADHPEGSTTWTQEEERRLVRKLDLRLMPFAMLMFLVAYLDRGNISNARTANGLGTSGSFEAQLGLTGDDFQFCVSIFFVTYILFEVPSNMVLKYFTPRVWFTRIMLMWGVISGCQAACQNKAGIVVCRLLVGLAEAGLLPGLLFWIGFWYRKYEIATRTALIHSMLALSSAFAGLIATGIGQMNGTAGLPTWRWIFIIEAIPSVILAVATLIWLPDFPHTATKFLTPREQQIAIARLPPSAPSHLQKHFDKDALIESFKDPMNLLYPVSMAIGVIPQLALQYFLPTVLADMGYTGATSNLMSAPPNLWGAAFEVVMAYHGDLTQERLFHILGPASIGLVGYVLLPIAGKSGWPIGVRYFLTFVANSGIASAPSWYAWRQNMVVGATTVAFVMGWTNSVVNIAGAVSPYLFPTQDRPYYEKGGYIGRNHLLLRRVAPQEGILRRDRGGGQARA